jgi:surfactin synthase thioesterase subunit
VAVLPVALLCLPWAGASASVYLRWQHSLPRWLRVVPVELPGRGIRMAEAFMDDFDELIECLCEAHERHSAARYALYGHSMGGLIAHAMALRWRSLSRRLPEALFVSASPAPKLRNPAYFLDKQTDTALLAELRKQGGTPAEVFDSEELLQIALETLRADYRLCGGYQYRDSHPLAVPIHAFAGREDDIHVQRILAWEAETSARFSVRWFDGGHFFNRRHEQAILDDVARTLSYEGAEVAGVDVALS